MRTSPLRGVLRFVVFLPLGLTVACGTGPAEVVAPAPPGPSIVAAPATTSTPPAPMPKNPAPRPAPRIADRSAEPLIKAAGRVEPGTTLGVLVHDRLTGEDLLAHNADRPFRTASLVKLLLAIDVLERGATPTDRDRLTRMLSVSDDDLGSLYWVRQGGAEMLARTSARLGLTGVLPPEVPGQWGEVVMTPRDVAAIYRYVLDLRPAYRSLIVNALADAPRLAADGFDQHFGIPDGLRSPWAVKQGWGNNDTAMVLHSTGLAGPDYRYVVVLLSEHPLGSGWATSARSVTAAATALRGLLPAG